MKTFNTQNVGSFKITSGQVMVSDPCYDLGTWCQGIIKNVKKGNWKAKILVTNEGDWGSRVAAIIAWHESISEVAYVCSSWNKQNFEVGVDAGMAGIFDLAEFHSEDDEYNNPNSWYRRCCDLTDNKAGIIDNSGIVSSSGYGDGSYECSTMEEGSGKVIAIMVDFGLLEEPEEDEEEDEYENEEEDDA